MSGFGPISYPNIYMKSPSVLLASFVSLTFFGCASYHELPLAKETVDAKLRVPRGKSLIVAMSEIKHPLLRKVTLDADDGLSPDEAAVLAVVLNPALRAARDQRDEAQAQLLQAGILPNPQMSANVDYLVGANPAGEQTAHAYGLSWDLRSLLTRKQEIASAGKNADAIHLDIAWQEWQIALEAQGALFDLAALNAEVAQAAEVAERLSKNSALIAKAESEHEKTVLDAAASESSANEAKGILLELKHERDQSLISLNRAIGYPSGTSLRPQSNVSLPSNVSPPSESKLLDGLEERRLDLLALKRGYESQDAKLRSAVMAQFPNISIGFSRATDTGNVKTAGPGVTIDLPVFDRNQGKISLEKATRQRLLDEYTNRVFEARSDIAAALAAINSLNGRIAHAERSLPTLRRVVDISEKAAAAGDADVLAYYSAQNDLTRSVIDTLKLKQQLARARVALEAAAAWHISS